MIWIREERPVVRGQGRVNSGEEEGPGMGRGDKTIE